MQRKACEIKEMLGIWKDQQDSGAIRKKQGADHVLKTYQKVYCMHMLHVHVQMYISAYVCVCVCFRECVQVYVCMEALPVNNTQKNLNSLRRHHCAQESDRPHTIIHYNCQANA